MIKLISRSYFFFCTKDRREQFWKYYSKFPIIICSCHSSYHPGSNISNVGDPILPLIRSVYPPQRLMPQPPPPPPQPYLHPSPPSSRLSSYPSQYPMNDNYYIGHVLGSSSTSQQNLNHLGAIQDSNYTCIGAPFGHGFGPSAGPAARGGGAGSRDLSLSSSYAGVTQQQQQQRLDHPSTMINRFQDGGF